MNLLGKSKEIINRIKVLWKVSAEYDKDKEAVRWAIGKLHDRIGKHTTIHADIHWKRPHQIIVVGKYKNRDYVRVFDVRAEDLAYLVEHLKALEPRAKVGRFDMPHAMPLSVVYERDRF